MNTASLRISYNFMPFKWLIKTFHVCFIVAI